MVCDGKGVRSAQRFRPQTAAETAETACFRPGSQAWDKLRMIPETGLRPDLAGVRSRVWSPDQKKKAECLQNSEDANQKSDFFNM